MEKSLYQFTVPADAPCLKGHFPGNPIVPGAYLLSLISEYCAKELNLHIQKIGKVKFVQSLKPGQKATLSLEISSSQVKFSIKHGDQTILSGKADASK